ncbi:hypothetical protein Tco_0769697 [Tanacetum coccineum]|uniref:Uncharacterized protein n=1 Tax=Tanacetum coccineum TaxID=301880 RepID=A0ABQ4ZCR3_9ASTR
MERGFLSQNGSGVGRGVREKQSSMADMSVKNINDVATVNNVANNGTMVGPTPAGNTPGMSTSYANVIGAPSRKAVNFRTLITSGGNGVDVVVPVESIHYNKIRV